MAVGNKGRSTLQEIDGKEGGSVRQREKGSTGTGTSTGERGAAGEKDTETRGGHRSTEVTKGIGRLKTGRDTADKQKEGTEYPLENCTVKVFVLIH